MNQRDLEWILIQTDLQVYYKSHLLGPSWAGSPKWLTKRERQREKEAALLTELSCIPFNTFCNELIKAFFPAERLKALFKNWHPPFTFMNSLIKILAKSHITHTSTSNSVR